MAKKSPSAMVLSISILVSCLRISYAISSAVGDNIDELTDQLTENLRNDPFVIANSKSSEAEEFIDKQFEKYETLMLQTQEKQFSRSKRSLPRNENTTEKNLVDLEPFMSLEKCMDLVLFEQQSNWYAACLNGDDEGNSTLRIMKYQNGVFKLTKEKEIWKGLRIAVAPLGSSTLVIVAENCTTPKDFHRRSNVFEFTQMEILKTVQRLNTSFNTDLAIWEDERNIFMSATQFMKETSAGRTLRVQTPIYKWLGKHFDVIQEVETSGGSRITPFDIDGSRFLALANSQNDEGGEKVYSKVLKYNLHTEKYELHQNILTYGCRDMKYFRTDVNKETEHFLIVANHHRKDIHGALNYETLSIIYKMVDDYFIPFQSLQLKGVSQWESIIVGDEDDLLIALTMDGLIFFQYDGWHFKQINMRDSTQIRISGNERMNTFEFEGKSLLGIQNGNKTDLFQIKFTSQNELKQRHDEILSWCRKNLNLIEHDDNIELLGGRLIEDSMEELDSGSQVKRNGSELVSTLEKLKSLLSQIETDIQKSLQNIQQHTMEEDIKIEHLILRDNTMVNSGDIQSVNGMDMNVLLENILNINDGFLLNSSLEFDNLRTEEPIHPNYVNNHSVDTILRRASKLQNLTVNGSVIFKDDFTVNTINDIEMSDSNVLLDERDQKLRNFSVESLFAENISAEMLNDHLLESMKASNSSEEEDTGGNEVGDSLAVNNLIIGGFVDGVDISTLYKYALRKDGHQFISKTYYFDTLKAESLITDDLAGERIPNNLIDIRRGTFNINKDVMFKGALSVKNLTALQNLNNINVLDRSLDVLLKDSNERQYVSGTKSFENLELLSPIKLNGQIRGEAFGTMSPLVKVDQDVERNGDVRITGNVVSEGKIRLKNIIAKNGKKSWGDLLENGVMLGSENMPIHLSFSQHINLNELSADTINSIEPSSWLVNGAKQTQIVHGSKQFEGDLEITGDTTCRRINDIDMAELEGNVLWNDGDQIVTGKHHVKYVATEKELHTNNTEFGIHPWREVLTTDDNQVISGNMLFRSDLSADSIVVRNLTVDGLIDGVDFSEVVTNIVTLNSTFEITGNKTFKSLKLDDLHLTNSHLDTYSRQLAESRLEMSDLTTLEDISVDSLHFSGNCNNLSLIEPEDEEEMRVLDFDDQEFDAITVFGNVFIESNRLNNVDMEDLELNTVKVDEPHRFESAEFINDVIVSDTIALDGHVDNLDLDNLLRNEEGGRQTILDVLDRKHFHENVTILGAVHINGNLNGVNVSDLCGFASDVKDAGGKLIVQGNAVFTKGPHVFRFNQEVVTDLENAIWFKDKEVVLHGAFELENNVTFNDNVNIQGLVNDVSFRKMTENYLSKTKDQNVTATLNFMDGIVCHEDIVTPELLVGGKVNDLKISEFPETVLLHRPQLFENKLFFEGVTVETLDGDYSVNKLNMNSDVMRYDSANMVTGPKSFDNLEIGTLRIDKNITVQGIDILHWLMNAVTKHNSSRMVGKISFNSFTAEKGIGLVGELNDFSLKNHSIMLRNIQQNVTGHKSFNPITSEGIKFKAMKTKGSVNGLDLADIVNEQAYQHGVTYVKSSINFNNVSMKNLVCEKSYQGLNVSQLLKNITNLETLNDFTNNYRTLSEMSKEINQSLEERALYLDYFKTIPYFPNANEVFSAKCDQHDSRVLIFNNKNGSTIVNFLDWSGSEGIFVESGGYEMDLGTYPDYIKYVTSDGYDYIYIEHETPVDGDEKSDLTYTGELIHFSQNTTFRHHSFLTKGTVFITSFSANILRKHCLLFIDYSYGINILCRHDEEEFYLQQTIDDEKAEMASVLDLQQSPCVVTARKEEPRVAIWHFSENNRFEIAQTYHEGDPISLSTISCSHGQFIAVAYGHLPNTKDHGRVVIRKYDPVRKEFAIWQIINLKAPLQIDFALLPSQELVLFVTTMNPSEPFNTYIYEGISGFTKKTGGPTIHNVLEMNQISLMNEHFIVAKHVEGMSIIQAIFKGVR